MRCAGSLKKATVVKTCLHLAIGPPRDLNDHVQDGLLLVGVQGDIMERGDGHAILLDIDAVLKSVWAGDLSGLVGRSHVGRGDRRRVAGRRARKVLSYLRGSQSRRGEFGGGQCGRGGREDPRARLQIPVAVEGWRYAELGSRDRDRGTTERLKREQHTKRRTTGYGRSRILREWNENRNSSRRYSRAIVHSCREALTRYLGTSGICYRVLPMQ